MVTNNIAYLINGTWYYKRGYFGCQLYSSENKVKVGDLRVILDRIIVCYSVHKFLFSKNEVTWSIIKPTPESIRSLYEDMDKI